MQVFISWSGDLSLQIAKILKEWLPSVLQYVQPYVSVDIDKGARWSTDIASTHSSELESSSYGIFVLTKDNRNAPWILFEAGAISKQLSQSHVTPFLFNMSYSDLKYPLAQFQATLNTEEDVYKLLKSINNSAANGISLDEIRLRSAFDKWWPELEEKLRYCSENTGEDENMEPDPIDMPAVLEEMLDLLRQQQRLLNNPEMLLTTSHTMQKSDHDITGFKVSIGAIMGLTTKRIRNYIGSIRANTRGISDLIEAIATQGNSDLVVSNIRSCEDTLCDINHLSELIESQMNELQTSLSGTVTHFCK